MGESLIFQMRVINGLNDELLEGVGTYPVTCQQIRPETEGYPG